MIDDTKEIRFYRQRNNGTYNETPLIMEGVRKWAIRWCKYKKRPYLVMSDVVGRWEIDNKYGSKITGDYKTIIQPIVKQEWDRRQEAKKKEAEEREKAIKEEIYSTIQPEFAPFVDFLRKNMKVRIYRLDEWDHDQIGAKISIGGIDISSDTTCGTG
jgi:hypothetical protein